MKLIKFILGLIFIIIILVTIFLSPIILGKVYIFMNGLIEIGVTRYEFSTIVIQIVLSFITLLAILVTYIQSYKGLKKTQEMTLRLRKSEIEINNIEKVKEMFSDYLVTLLEVNDIKLLINNKHQTTINLYKNIEQQYSKLSVNGILENFCTNIVNCNKASTEEMNLLVSRRLLVEKFKETYLYTHEFINFINIEPLRDREEITRLELRKDAIKNELNSLNNIDKTCEVGGEIVKMPPPYGYGTEYKSIEKQIEKLGDEKDDIDNELNKFSTKLAIDAKKEVEYIENINKYVKELRKLINDYTSKEIAFTQKKSESNVKKCDILKCENYKFDVD